MITIFGLLVLGVVIALVLPPLGWAFGRILRSFWMRAGRRLQQGNRTVVAEYEAPAGLRPAEIAYLYDRTFGEEELLATLFDLELRGKIKLSAIKGQKGNFLVEVQCKATDPELTSYESDIILACLHPTTDPTWAALRTDTVLWDNPFETALENELRKQGLLDANDDRERIIKWVLAGIALILSFIVLSIPVRPFEAPRITDVLFSQTKETAPTVVLDSNPNRNLLAVSADKGGDSFAQLDAQVALFFLAVVCVVQAGILYWSLRISRSFYLRALNMERGTRALRLLWPKLDGYRIFLQQVELNRIHFSNESDHQIVLHNALPYAIALNLTTRWQDWFTE